MKVTSMKAMKILSTVAVLSALFVSMTAKADMVTDAHGNVGYDTAAECDAAVASGTARFYTPFTHKAPLKRKGEVKVQTATLKDMGEQYARGACDVGVGRRMGREGVSTVLQGKFIPFSPEMPVNVYTDKSGSAVRITMAQCDNWFSGSAPRPVALVSAPVASAPVSTVEEEVAPVVAPAAPAFAVKPYVFGTLGALRAGTKATYAGPQNIYGVSNDNDTRFAGQVGFGTQFNDWLGAELFYTGSAPHKFDSTAYLGNTTNSNLKKAVDNGWISGTQSYVNETQQHTYGARLTLGKNLTDKFRLFAKGGVAGTTMKIEEVTGGQGSNGAPDAIKPTVQSGLNSVHSAIKNKLEGQKGTFARATAGIGATYNLNDKLAVRGDYDHYFKKNYDHNGHTYTAKGKHYVGVGIQYNFR